LSLGLLSDADVDREALKQTSVADMPLRSLLTPTVVIPIANYAILAFLDISLSALLPLFFSTPTYLGGLGFVPSSIGSWLAMFWIVNGFFQALFFVKIVNRLGPKRFFSFSVSCFAPVVVVFPIMSWLVHTRGTVDHTITFALLSQLALIISWSMAFGAYYDENLLIITSHSFIICRNYLLIYHSLCPCKERPWRCQWSCSNHRVDGPCRWARLNNFALRIFEGTQYSQWKRSVSSPDYTGWCIDVVGIPVTR
jgi:hypothetical protein